ncbi:hypothetical protein H6F93_01280 [Leptolyngbya sp. FACHB-671]|uniref:hypothetical protein n=1 Tax=Leptolyngbya sp. FACHB-671 TaxID=2692812 RepID=UPI001688B2D0|nr:hypothetical protein [Leptolyngbya sp. FACHB-671]MBD2066171.1 hypothetical protein [Leptolyngbya sp. FACHB-671]
MLENDQQAALAAAINRLVDVLERLEPLLEKLPQLEADFVNKYQAAPLLDVHPKTLDTYRKEWIEGIHWIKVGGKVLYNQQLLKDWRINRHDARAHQRAIEYWASQQPGNKSRRRS